MSALCLVPTSLRAARVARRLCDAEGDVLLETRVTTPDAIVPRLLAASGDRRPVLPPFAERLIALEVGEARGGALADLPPGSELAQAFAASLLELRRAEAAPALLEAAAAELEGGPRERLRFLALALAAYETRLDELPVLDRAGATRAATVALARKTVSDELRDLDVFVLEGFTALAPATADLVAGVARRARRTQVRVPYFPERPDLSFPAESLVRRIEGLHGLSLNREVEIVFEQLAGDRAPRLARLLLSVAGGRGPGGGNEGGRVLAGIGAGQAGTFEKAAEMTRRLLEDGLAPEEIVILAPSPQVVAAGLARACAACGVPFASGRGEPLSAQPVVLAVLAALGAALHPGRASLERVATSPYLGLARVPRRLGHWLDRAGALDGRGDPEEALRRRAESLHARASRDEREALLHSASALSEVAGALRPLARTSLAGEHAARLRSFLSVAGARRRAARGERGVARRDLAALGRLEEVADEVVRALAFIGRANERMPADRWLALLEAALADAVFHAGAEPLGGAVELWPISEAPGLRARAGLLMGCERGSLPRPPPAEVFLREDERAALARVKGRSVVATSSMRRAEAMHTAFCALGVGREVVGLVWRGSGPEGEGSAPSPLAQEVLVAAGVDPPMEATAPPGIDESRSASEALRAVARASRGRGTPLPAVVAEAPELARRAASVLARGQLEHERRRAVLARRAAAGAGAVGAALLGELGEVLPSEWTPSQLEEYARCPYRVFSALALGLEEPESNDLDPDPRDEGRLAHLVLERFLRGRIARGEPPLRGDPEETSELEEVAVEVFARFEAEGRAGDPAVWPGRRRSMLSRLRRVVRSEAKAASGLAPALLEYRFGGDSEVAPLVFADAETPGGAVLVQGRIDRVDASADRLLLIDYKSGRRKDQLSEKLQPASLGTTNFQLPIYLLVASRALTGRNHLEATYLLLGTGERLKPFATEPWSPLFAVPGSASQGRVSESASIAEAVVSAVRRVRAGDFPIVSRDCTHCAYGALCRVENQAEEGA